MGRRKDRMLAAMHNAGRRVKLDLFAEPSGDLGGSSVDEVGKGTESKQSTELPKSPSSSDQPQQNPLLLLGQYSDDEVDEESNERVEKAVVDNPSADEKKQVKGSSGERSENFQVNTAEDLIAKEVKQQDKEVFSEAVQKADTKESDATAGHIQSELKFGEQTFVAGTSDGQVAGDVSSGWMMVLHEESNRYYYWNVETGETSWEVPQALAQSTGLTFEQETTLAENTQTDVNANECDSTVVVQSDFHPTAATIDDSMGTDIISESPNVDEYKPKLDERIEGVKSEVQIGEYAATDVSQTQLSSGVVLGDAFCANESVNETGPEMSVHGSLTDDEKDRSPVDLSSALVRRSEHLLEKLKSLEGSKGHLNALDRTSKFVLEVEIRLSDFKSLLSHGSSLLPFWLHSERQLKRLEDAIDKEIYHLAKSQVDELMETDISLLRGEEKSFEMGHEPQADGNRDRASHSSSAVISNAACDIETTKVVEKELHHEASLEAAVNSTASPRTQLQSDAKVGEQVGGSVSLDDSITNPTFYDGEDTDMDVDMEVDDTAPPENTSTRDTLSTKDFAQPEQLTQPIPPSDDVFVPPPPDEEWIPPPPPDGEQIPPPPPDEPPETSYTSAASSYMGTAQPLSFPEQYLSYSASSFAYYGPTGSEVPGSNFYGHVDGSQVQVPQPSIYYGALPNSYNETASVMINPVESVAYYGVPDGATPTMPVTGGVESSVNYSEPGPPGDNMRNSEVGGTIRVDVLPVNGETDATSVGGASSSATIQAPPSMTVKENLSDVSANTTSSAAANTTTSTTKVQSKALRSKKRTIAAAPSLSLRSNKKVSNLVDKWKAAKEELKQDEDEPKNAVEILERKRQREIEEWYAQQIASGEAKDNANFQPLGGDWREKVKRRRAEAAKEAAKEEAAKTSAEAKADEKKQPSLVDLSRDLPSGWQAYWDESSKQVYYGNLITSETTWTRPTK